MCVGVLANYKKIKVVYLSNVLSLICDMLPDKNIHCMRLG